MDTLTPLQQVINSADFREYESEYQQSFADRRAAVEAKLRALARATFPSSGVALIARGSVARGDLSLYSDVDLLLITETATDCSYIDERLIQDCIERRTSLVRVGFAALDARIIAAPHLAYAFGCARFICGDKDLAAALHTTAVTHLTSLPPHAMLALRAADPLRTWKDQDPTKPHYYSLKQGKGGIIDHEFIKLADIWLKARDSLCAAARAAVCVSCLAYGYLVVLKEFLHRWSEGPLESCQPLYDLSQPSRLSRASIPPVFRGNIIDLVRAEHAAALGVVLDKIQLEVD